MQDALVQIATPLVTEGAKWLYAQTRELLRAWAKKKEDSSAEIPIVEPPHQVILETTPSPLAQPINETMLQTLQTLKDAAEDIKDGQIEADAPEARVAMGQLRRLLEIALGTKIQFEGEPPRTLQVTDVEVTVEEVTGIVNGVRANLDKLRDTRIQSVKVKSGNVKPGATVTGVDVE